MLMTDVDHWDIFSVTDEIILIFPRFKKDFGIGMRELYYHKEGYYYINLRNNSPQLKNVRLNLVRYFKTLNTNGYRFYPGWVLHCTGEAGIKEIISVIKSESFLEDIFAKLVNLRVFSTPVVNLYPIKFIEGIRIDRSTIIGKRFDDSVDFCKVFSEKLINYQPSLQSIRYTKVTESANLGWLEKYMPEDVDKYVKLFTPVITITIDFIQPEIFYLG